MKRFAPMNWKSLLVLAFLVLPTAPLAGQTEARLREVRERQELALQQIQERHQEAQYRVQERLVRVRVREMAEMAEQGEHRVRDIQQVIVRLRARVRLGVSLDPDQGEEYDSQGVLLKDVLDDSPAEDAGLEEGDIITHLGGQSLVDPIPDEDDEEFDEDESLPVQRLMALARELEDGEEVEIRYLRDGAAASLTLKAAEMDDRWTMSMPRSFGRGVYRFSPGEERGYRFFMPDDDEIRMEIIPHLEGLKELQHLREFDFEFPEIEFEKGNAWTFRTKPDIAFFGPGNQTFRGRGGSGYRVFPGGDDYAFGFMFGSSFQGLELRELNPDLGEYFSTDRGVLVMEVDEDSALGLRPGDVILSIGDREVEDTGDVFRILRSYEEDEAVSFTVMRHGQETRVDGTMG